MFTLTSRPVALCIAAVVILAGCTSDPSPSDDPQGAARAAFEQLADSDAVAVSMTLDGRAEAGADRPAGADALLSPGGAELQLRSAVGEAAHARVLTSGEARAAMEDATEQLREVGVDPLAEQLSDEGWVRISVPTPDDADSDRLARGLGEAGVDVVEAADEVTYVAEEELGERLEVVADADVVRRFVDEVVEVVTSPGTLPDDVEAGEPGDDGEPASDADTPAVGDTEAGEAVDIWLVGGELRALAFQLEGGGALSRDAPRRVLAEFDPAPAEAGFPTGAPSFALRALISETLDAAERAAVATADESGTADTDPDPAEDADPGEVAEPGAEGDPEPEGDPAPLREGGVLEEVFGDDVPFREGAEFDCVTEQDLEVIGGTFGPEAVEEFEELIELGYLERC